MKVTIKSITTKKIVEYIADFARVSRDRDEVETTEAQDLSLCKRLWKDNERTAFECINIDFLVEDVSRSLLAQITRYRHATFMVKSQRYVKLGKDDEFIFPDLSYIKDEGNREKAYDVFGGISDRIKEDYDYLIMLGAKPEDARAILMNATPTRFRIVCNLRSFFNFYEQRNTFHAQTEIRTLAGVMLGKIYEEIGEDITHSLLAYIEESFVHTLKDLMKAIKDARENENCNENFAEDLASIMKEFEEFV